MGRRFGGAVSSAAVDESARPRQAGEAEAGEPLWLGIDIGTLSAKAALVDADGAVLGVGRSGYLVSAPYPAWAESDPEEWWRAAAAAVRQVLADYRSRRDLEPRVMALGLAGQMHGVVACDADGRPVRAAVTWADSRAGAEADDYRRLLTPELLGSLANQPSAGMAGPILMWLRRNEPETLARARWALQPKDWLRLRFTGEAAAEPSDASATLLFHVEHDRWSLEAARLLGVDERLLAPLVASDAVAGHLLPKAAAELGLSAGLPVVAGAADTAAAALGNAVSVGDVHLTIGSGAQLVALMPNLGRPVSGANVYRSAEARGWYQLLPIHNAGIALEWVLDALGLSWDEAYELAAAVPAGSEGAVFTPLLSAERAVARGSAGRGSWTGLGLHHGRGHLVRSALEGVADLIAAGLRELTVAGLADGALVVGGGGAERPLWRAILEASLGRTVRLAQAESTLERGGALQRGAASARGAALLALRGVPEGRDST